ncbi:rhomboid family intramembrane serine protease [Herbiconiux sp. CPCC 205763]|uniref:Rhomboid family intramembrane serine protease n=1 Tax=Herbiconiux aconitum TaxID=2970913 RepID=A0ABT2GMJ6_9MICO|nr:rhomboid family intramembrane serine protease [Herbiconiux aconitum]MCS5717448.1 rhomboid family intramembrane serine protease [Herbiconiux aconitum]
MTTAPDTPDNYCYRHPGRQSFILCQRCGRTVCPDCQVQAAVGVHCVECAAQDRREAPRVRRGRPALLRNLTGSGAPVVTYTLIAICLVVFGLQSIPGLGVTQALQFAPAYVLPIPGAPFEPWRMITSVFTHGSILHVLLNMYTLFIFGSVLERMLGRWRYLALFLISGLGGSVAVVLLAGPLTAVVGASGAIFGLMGAFFIINRHLGGNSVQLLVLVAINLAYGFFVPGISWQAHVGGLVAGAIVALIFVRTRPIRKRNLQIVLLAAVVAALIAITAVRALV